MNLKLHVIESHKVETLDADGKPVVLNAVVLCVDPADDDAKKNFVGVPTGQLTIGNLTDAGVAALDLSTTHALAPVAAPKEAKAAKPS